MPTIGLTFIHIDLPRASTSEATSDCQRATKHPSSLPERDCHDATMRDIEIHSIGAMMGSTNDEQHPETTQQQLSSDNTTSTHSNDAPRLTPMPRWLMHWWTPLAIAAGLLRWTLIVAFFWGGQPHWPSSEAMKLCMTITGAGLTFSAWQQRSHDNAANAKQAQATAEREDYWKRREHIFRTLGSSNPRIRLGAIAMLTELADSAEFSERLNNTEKQLLQQHIIDTLCLQMKYEGHAQKSEGSKEERSKIQLAITTAILQRINETNRRPKLANWSDAIIDFTQAKILTPITIDNIHTSAHLDFQYCTFTEDLIITDSTLNNITWRNARFINNIFYYGKNEECVVRAGELPHIAEKGSFLNTIFACAPGSTFDLDTVAKHAHSSIILNNCKFYSTNCTCPPECKCKTSNTSKQCNCLENKDCTCETRCIHANIIIGYRTSQTHQLQYMPQISISKCHTGAITIVKPINHHGIRIIGNDIRGQISIVHPGILTPADAKEDVSNKITISENKIHVQDTIDPIHISLGFSGELDNLIISNNELSDPSNSQLYHPIICSRIYPHYPRIHFEIPSIRNPRDSRPLTWDAGYYIGDHVEALGCGRHWDSDSALKVTCATATEQSFIHTTYTSAQAFTHVDNSITEWPNDFPSQEEIMRNINDNNCYIIADSYERLAVFITFVEPYTPYASIIGKWRSRAEYRTVRCLACFTGRGIAQKIFDFASQESDYLRSDTHVDNLPMRHALEVFGFKECGTFVAEDGSTRVAYDWIKEAAAHN